MIVTFIYPAVGKKENEQYPASWKMEPLPIMTLAALTPPDIEVKFYDDRIDKIDYDHQTDLVAINMEAYSALRAYNVAKEFKKRGKAIVFGGYHATLMPQEAALRGDSVVVGEAENVWPQVIRDAKEGLARGDIASKLRQVYKSEVRPVFGRILPRRDIIDGKKYSKLALVETGRGCRFACNFCSIEAFFKSTYSFLSPQTVVKIIESTDKRLFFFVDDNLGADSARAKQLFEALIPLKISWVGQLSINMAKDEKLLALMRKSGCQGVLIGFESLNRENLRQMNKAWNISVDYSESLKKLHDNGLCIYATFMFGYDHDTARSFEDTVEFARQHRFFLAAFNHLMPFPGTQYYKTLEDENRIIHKNWWLDPEYTFGKIVFQPRNMSPAELETRCYDARNRFYAHGSILKRWLDFKTNSSSLLLSGIFLYQNLKAKNDVGIRRGLPLSKNLDTPFK